MISRYTNRGWRLSPALILVAALVAVICSAAMADDDIGVDFKKGLWSVSFGLEDDFQVRAIDGILISFKKHKSPKSAYRLEFALNATSQSDGPLPVKRYPRNQRQSRDAYSNYDGNWADIEMRLLYVQYSSSENRVRPFWGVGPCIGYYRYDFERIDDVIDPFDWDIDWDYSYGLSGGITGAFGVEWFAWEQVSILAEYRGSIVYTYWSQDWNERREGEVHASRQISRQMSLSTQSVDFGLVVYF